MRSAYFRCIPVRISGTIGPYPVTTKRAIILTSTSQSWSLALCEKLENKQTCRTASNKTRLLSYKYDYKRINSIETAVEKQLCYKVDWQSVIHIFYLILLNISNIWRQPLQSVINPFFIYMYILQFIRLKMLSIVFCQWIICIKASSLQLDQLDLQLDSSLKKFIIVIMMKSQKFIACFKSQKSLSEGLLKEEFFEEVMDKIKEELTQEEHEYLITFILQNKLRDKTTLNDNTAAQFKASPSPKNEESPLMHIRQDVFKDVKKSLKRLVTLTQDTSVIQEQPRNAFTSTTRKRIKPRQHFHTIFTQQQNKMPKSALQNKKQENVKHFTISQRKKRKYIDSKSFSSILNNRKVLQAYDNNFLKDIFGVDECGFLNEFGERYLLTTPQPQEKVPLYAKLREKHKAEEDKYRSLNSLQFDRAIGRNRTAVKLHSRKY